MVVPNAAPTESPHTMPVDERAHYQTAVEAHFRPELGHLLISTVYRPDPDAEGIGVRVTPANIDEHLAETAGGAEQGHFHIRGNPTTRARATWLRSIGRNPFTPSGS